MVNIITNTIPSVKLAPAVPNNGYNCGASFTFTATPTNGGTNPAYNWFVDGINVGFHPASYTRPLLSNFSIVKVVMTANLYCKNTPNTTSNSDTVIVSGCATRLMNPDAVGNTTDEATNFELYPNPAMDNVAIRYQLPENNANAATISMMDIAGRMVKQQTIEHPETIGVAHFDLNQLQAGIYLVNVKTTGYTETKRLVVSR